MFILSLFRWWLIVKQCLNLINGHLQTLAVQPERFRTLAQQHPQPAGEVDLDQVNLPDPMLDRMEALVKRLTVLESCLARHARRLGCEGCEAAPEDAPCHGQCTDESEPADTAQ